MEEIQFKIYNFRPTENPECRAFVSMVTLVHDTNVYGFIAMCEEQSVTKLQRAVQEVPLTEEVLSLYFALQRCMAGYFEIKGILIPTFEGGMDLLFKEKDFLKSH